MIFLGAFDRLFKKETSEQRFWQWFAAKSAQIFDFEQNQEPLFDELSHALNRVHKSLCFEFGPKGDNGKREFIISADGNREAFPAVQNLVATAPDLEQWQITAFRPRRPADFIKDMALQIGDLHITEEQIGFVAEPDANKVGLTLFVKEHDVQSEAVLFAAFIMLDTILGEYDVETKIGFIAHQPWIEEQTNVQPLTQLAGAVDALFEKINR